MKKLLILFFLIASVSVNGQKVKIKKGKVFIDKKEALTYEKTKLGTVYSSLDGVNLFRLKRETIEKDNPNQNAFNTSDDPSKMQNAAANLSDPIRRGNRYAKKKKVNYNIVSFSKFKLEFETTLSAAKLIREFVQEKVIQDGRVDMILARQVADKLKKNISGN